MKLLVEHDNIISFSSLKTILKKVIILENISEEYIRSMRICNIFLDDSQDINYSLTSSMTSENQIRYYTKNRLLRSLKSIAKLLNEKCPNLKVEIYNSIYLDEGTKMFVNILNNMVDNTIIIKLKGSIDNVTEIYTSVEYTSTEKKIVNILKNNNLNQAEYDFLIKKAEEYINIGDYLTSKKILHFIEKFIFSVKVFSNLATVYTMEGNVKLSKKYLDLWYDYGDIYNKAHACYSLGMLYARHLDRNVKNDKIAENYIEQGYKLLNKVKILDDQALTRDKVFNRNGLALLLFKYGKLDEAIEIEKESINILENLQGETALLQKSVLLYNLGQCYSKQGNYYKSIKVYDELLSIDPYFAEYYLEQAKNYLEINDYNNMQEFLLKAKKIDSSITEVYSLLGYSYYLLDDQEKSIKYYQQAWLLDPRQPEVIYDYLFILNEYELYHESYEILIKLNIDEEYILNNANILVNIISEILINIGKIKEGEYLINKALEQNPNNEEFLINKKLIQELIL